MFEIKVKSQFNAAHHYSGVGGPERSLHGHTFNVSVFVNVADEFVNELGLTVHPRDIRKTVDKVVSELDHRNLNDMDEFEDRNPTLESIAVLVYHSLKGVLPKFVSIAAVEVKVDDQYSVKYVDK